MNIPERDHLQRLSTVWIKNPIFFLTVCTAQRQRILDQSAAADEMHAALRDAERIHGWVVGRYVIMPDHLHFFARPRPDAKRLSAFMRDWKRWTALRISRAAGCRGPLWQNEFFDHVLRSTASYAEKWEYVRMNPVRARLVTTPEDWPHQGEINALTF